MAPAKVPPLSPHSQSSTFSSIHLVRRTANSEVSSEPQVIQVQDVVRETLLIIQECNPSLMESDRLLVELVTSLVLVRLIKAGAR